MSQEEEEEREVVSPRSGAAGKSSKGGKGKAFFSNLFGKKKKEKKAAPPDSPLQRDEQQGKLVADAKKKQKSRNSPLSPRSTATAAAAAPSSVKAAGDAPPPLPPKVRRGSLEDCFKVCRTCEARNMATRDSCVSCGAALEALAGDAAEVQRKLEAELEARRQAAAAKAEHARQARLAEEGSGSEFSEEEPVLEAAKCVVSGLGVEDGPQRVAPVEFTVEPRGLEDQPLVKAGGQVSARVIGPGEVAIAVDRQQRADGTVEFSYDRSRAGTYTVMVETTGGVAISESPYSVSVASVADPALCEASGPGLEAGVFAKVPTEFTVSLRDISNVYIEDAAGAEVTTEVADAAAETVSSIADNGDGTFRISLEYPSAQTWQVSVRVNGSHVKGSPFAVEVEKKPSAGSKWQEQYEQQAELRRMERERERLAEIEEARAAYIEQAKAAVQTAAEKEAAQLAEEERQRKIAEHQELMRSPRGDEVRANVLAKLQEQAVTDTTLEPDRGDDTKAGSKWAAAFREEDEARRAQREEERQREIEEAKQNYIETAEEAKLTAAQKESAQLAEEERLRKIAEHQEEVRKRGLEDDPNDALSSDDSTTTEQEQAAEEQVAAEEKQEEVAEEPKKEESAARRRRQKGVPSDNGVTLTYQQVKGSVQLFAGNEGVDITQIEAHFSDDEFKTVFNMDKDAFYKMPNWRRAQMRKEKGL